jgi:hypothetical protein
MAGRQNYSDRAMPLSAQAELLPGDLMLRRYGGGWIHKAIAAGQGVLNPHIRDGNKMTVHAAICYDPDKNKAAEAAGPGLVFCDYDVTKEEWLAYRYVDKEVSGLAVMVAESYIAEKLAGLRTGNYSVMSAFASNFHSNTFGPGACAAAEALWGGNNTGVDQSCFFCSDYAVRCYLAAGQLVKKIPIALPFNAANPRSLESFLRNSTEWKEVPNSGPIFWE